MTWVDISKDGYGLPIPPLQANGSPHRLSPRSQNLPNLIPQAVFPAIGALGRRQRPHQAELRGYAFDPVRGIDVLDQGDLVAGRGALAGDDGRVGEEVLPYLQSVLVD